MPRPSRASQRAQAASFARALRVSFAALLFSVTASGVILAQSAKRALPLPERLSPASLHWLIVDLAGGFQLVDLRPAPQFTDFHLPGSQNATIDDVVTDPAYLAGMTPLVLVDRDGSLAMAVGGILSQKTARPIKVLLGGLEAYWKESVTLVTPASAAPVPASPAANAPAKGPAKAGAPALPAKKSSAGC